jgi:hypothetical protein
LKYENKVTKPIKLFLKGGEEGKESVMERG